MHRCDCMRMWMDSKLYVNEIATRKRNTNKRNQKMFGAQCTRPHQPKRKYIERKKNPEVNRKSIRQLCCVCILSANEQVRERAWDMEKKTAHITIQSLACARKKKKYIKLAWVWVRQQYLRAYTNTILRWQKKKMPNLAPVCWFLFLHFFFSFPNQRLNLVWSWK